MPPRTHQNLKRKAAALPTHNLAEVKHEPIFSRSRPREMAAAIRRYIEEGIATQKLRHGDKLPNERELAIRFGTGRNTVRKLLIALEGEGKIYRHVGQGTFIKADTPDTLDETARGGVGAADVGNVSRIASPLDLKKDPGVAAPVAQPIPH